MQDYWLPTPFASFPFTSPPVRHRVPSHPDSALTAVRLHRTRTKGVLDLFKCQGGRHNLVVIWPRIIWFCIPVVLGNQIGEELILSLAQQFV